MAAVVDKKVCVGCGACTVTCPVEAIKLLDGVAQIDPAKCISCGACAATCPVSAIKLQVNFFC